MEVAGETGGAAMTTLAALRVAQRRDTVGRLVYGSAAVFALLLALTAVVHFESFGAGRLDLGSMAQAVWSTAHGHFLESTSLSGREISRLGVHVDPFLALLVPLWWVWSSPLMLLVVQVLAVSTGALPVFWLARKHLGSERAAAHFAFAYLLYPATQFNALSISGIHAVSFAVPLILFAIWFLDEERLVVFAIFALLAASTKEEIPLAVGCLGIWYAVRHRRRVAGATIFVAGLAATVVDFLVIIPHYAPSGINPFVSRYSGVGKTPTGILHTAVTDPVALVQSVATVHKLVYLVLLLGPFLGLWLLEPLLFLGAVPDLVINLLSSRGGQTLIFEHYTAGIVPFAVAASILGAARLKHDRDRVSLRVLVAVSLLIVANPITFGLARGDFRNALPSNAARKAKAHALALIPAGIPVSASNELATYLSARRYIYTFPVTRDARWVIVDHHDKSYRDPEAARFVRGLHAIDRSQAWKTVYASHGVEVLRKAEGA